MGSSVFDTSTVTPTPGNAHPDGVGGLHVLPNGIVAPARALRPGAGPWSPGCPPTRATEGPLAAGSYSFGAVFTSGDANFTGSTSTCEPLTINAGTGHGHGDQERGRRRPGDGAVAVGQLGVRHLHGDRRPRREVHPDRLGGLHVLHHHRLAPARALRPGAEPWPPGCHPTRAPRGRWRRAPTASKPSIAVTPTLPARPAPASR